MADKSPPAHRLDKGGMHISCIESLPDSESGSFCICIEVESLILHLVEWRCPR